LLKEYIEVELMDNVKKKKLVTHVLNGGTLKEAGEMVGVTGTRASQLTIKISFGVLVHGVKLPLEIAGKMRSIKILRSHKKEILNHIDAYLDGHRLPSKPPFEKLSDLDITPEMTQTLMSAGYTAPREMLVSGPQELLLIKGFGETELNTLHKAFLKHGYYLIP
jgi:hypothetical protein